MPDPRDFLPPPPWEGPPVPGYLLKQYPFLRGTPYEIWRKFWPYPELIPHAGYYTVLDSKGVRYSLEPRFREGGFSWFLDNRHIVIDPPYGYIYLDPYEIPDKVLRENIDIIVFGEVMDWEKYV